MNKLNVILLICSVFLLFVSYNFAFNTKVTIVKYIALSGYKEGSYFYKKLSNKANYTWVRIIGYVTIVFSLICLSAAINFILK